MRFVTAVFHFFLLRLNPELAHGVGKWGLRLWQCRLRFSQRVFTRGRVIVLRGAPQLTLRGRVGLAAGFDKDAEMFPGLLAMGFGFIEVGTVTPRPQPGNPKPRIWRVQGQGLINHLGFNSGGLDAFCANLEKYRPLIPSGCLLANIGKNKATPDETAIEDYRICFERLVGKVDGFVVNLSSPNTPGLRNLQSRDFLVSLAQIAPKGYPVFVKLAPDLEDGALVELCAFIRAEKAFAGVVVTNTSRKIAEETFKRSAGGYSGPQLFARSLECVRLARTHLGTEKILIGVGGIDTPARAQQMLEAGADLAEIYTSFVYKGPQLAHTLNQI
jgi:dihydroorotate dehydrogenase